MPKITINHIGAFGIIYSKDNPSLLFLEVKDDGHPIERVRRKLCFIGGNWIDDVAKKDTGPFSTFSREFQEELSFKRPLHASQELVMLGLVSSQPFHAEPKPMISINKKDQEMLLKVKDAIIHSAIPFGDFINTALPGVLGADDSQNKTQNLSWLSSYYSIGLDRKDWEMLAGLQEKFNNLSNESITLIISLDEILKRGMEAAFGHDFALKEFFLSKGLSGAKNLGVTQGLKNEKIGNPLESYIEYMDTFNVIKHP